MLDINSTEYRQAALSINYELEALFRRNLDCFLRHNKVLYKKAEGYVPQRLGLRLDPKGYINLVNLNSGQYVYQIDPTDYARKQVDVYLKERPHISLRKNTAGALREDYPYTKFLDEYRVLYESIKPVTMSKDLVSYAFIMFGGGLNLQLQFLLNAIDVRHLTILETDFDAFYCSMHVIDWAEIYRYFERPGYSLDIVFVKEGDQSYEQIASSIVSLGVHKYSFIDLYYHYHNSEVTDAIHNIKNYCKNIIGSMGFFEDERVGLSHALVNLSTAVPILSKRDNRNKVDVSVLVIGNGPSLDHLIPFIKDNIDHYVIISCGSAIGALMKHAIVPDIHVEQERMLVTKEALLKGTTGEFRKGLRFIGLSPCHPEVFDLFDKKYMAIKSNDVSTDLFEELAINDFHDVKHCNPLVSNFGFSIAVDLGFKNIYLAGVDCGMADVSYHHSKASNIYFDAEGKSEQVYESSLTVPGNFREEVFTTDLFKFSKRHLESKINSSSKKLNVYNLSDGALILGAEPLKVADIKPSNVIPGKDGYVDSLLQKSFKVADFDQDKLDALVIALQNESALFVIKLKRLLVINDLSLDALESNFNQVEKLLRGYYDNNMAVYRLFNGSVRGVMLNVMHDKKVLANDVFALYAPKAELLITNFINEIERDIKLGFIHYDD